MAAADGVDISFWNHPRLYDQLHCELPASRWVMRSAVAVQEARLRGFPIESIPALADMARLEGFKTRPHGGIRVGYLGQVEPTKMHPRFADLCLAVGDPNVHFEVFGGGSWR